MGKPRGADALPHDEYHWYFMDDRRDPRHVHLTEEMVEKCRDLAERDYPENFYPKFYLQLTNTDADLVFVFYAKDPTYSEVRRSIFRTGSERAFGSPYKKPIWFDSFLFCESMGTPANPEQHHYKEIREETILPKHREQYMDEFIEDVEQRGFDTDWIER